MRVRKAGLRISKPFTNSLQDVKTRFPKLTETDLRASPQQDREGERVDVNRSSHRNGSGYRAVRFRGISRR